MYDRPGIEGPLIFIVPSVHDNRISGPKITKMYNSCNFVKMIHACRMSDFYDESYQIRAPHWSMWITRSRLVIN